MEATVHTKYLRCSARKMRVIADMIRNTPVDAAISQLFVLRKTKKSAVMVEKALKSAIANFKEKNADAGTENLKVTSILVDGGPLIKRIRPRSQGRAFKIHKQLCHLKIAISDS